MGRARVPSEKKKTRGTYRADRAKGEPQPRKLSRTPPAPEHLDEIAKKEWRRLGPELLGLNLLSALDLTALEVYCTDYSLWRRSLDQVAKNGPLLATPSGFLQQHPSLGIANQAQIRMRRWMQDFGMTPAARPRLNVAGAEEQDPYALFVQGKGRAKVLPLRDRTGSRSG